MCDLIQNTAVEDRSKTIAGVYPVDDKPAAASDLAKTHQEVAGMTKKKLTATKDDDALTEDFFMERTNR